MTLRRTGIAALALCANPCWAHTFGQTYTLPVPIWMYVYGAATALAISFVLVGYFVTARTTSVERREREIVVSARGQRLIAMLQWLSVGALALTIGAGFFGAADPYRNINMTLFWVVFSLGFTYLTALIGDWFALLNPFRVIVDVIARMRPGALRGRGRYPAALEYWPALALYVAFIWVELFGRTTPYSLAAALSVYVLINIAGCWLVGRDAWFERCEFFGVFLRLVSRIAPIDVVADGSNVSRLRLRAPFSALLQESTIPLSLLLFILFMLSSTAFDGLKETALWVNAFWKNLYQLVLLPLYGDASHISYPAARLMFQSYQTAALVLSPLFYFAVYALFVALARGLIGKVIPLRTMLLSFGYCLIPIAFVYHVTHYYTLLEIQGPQVVRMISDPLGLGWNLFGTARMPISVIPNLAVVWHVQVFLIVAGHVVSVYLAHLQALQLFSDRRTAILSQLPMLVLMVLFTTAGLWILSLPLGAAPIRID